MASIDISQLLQLPDFVEEKPVPVYEPDLTPTEEIEEIEPKVDNFTEIYNKKYVPIFINAINEAVEKFKTEINDDNAYPVKFGTRVIVNTNFLKTYEKVNIKSFPLHVFHYGKNKKAVSGKYYTSRDQETWASRGLEDIFRLTQVKLSEKNLFLRDVSDPNKSRKNVWIITFGIAPPKKSTLWHGRDVLPEYEF